MAAPACLDIVPELQKFRLDHKKYERKLKQLMQHTKGGAGLRGRRCYTARQKAPDLGGQWQTRGGGVIGSEEAKPQ